MTVVAPSVAENSVQESYVKLTPEFERQVPLVKEALCGAIGLPCFCAEKRQGLTEIAPRRERGCICEIYERQARQAIRALLKAGDDRWLRGYV